MNTDRYLIRWKQYTNRTSLYPTLNYETQKRKEDALLIADLCVESNYFDVEVVDTTNDMIVYRPVQMDMGQGITFPVVK